MPSSTTITTPSVLRFLSSRSLTTPRPATTTVDDPPMADSDHPSSKPLHPSKSASFSGLTGNKNSTNTDIDDNVTLIISSDSGDQVNEEEEEEEDELTAPEVDFESGMRAVAPEIDGLISELMGEEMVEVPDGFERFAVMMEDEIGKYESGNEPGKWYKVESGESPLLEAVEKMCKVVEALAKYQSEGKYAAVIDRATNVVQRAMVFLEEEFRCLLEESRSVGELDQLDSSGKSGDGSGKTNRQESLGVNQEGDMCV